MSEVVLVFKKDLFPNLATDGFSRTIALLPEILFSAEWMERDKAETNLAYKQLIPYSILRYDDCVFRYKRSAWGSEERLHGLFSLGVGGHINRTDELPLWNEIIPIVEWTRDRELNEEFNVKAITKPRLIGVLNDESNEVGQVHLGVIYEYWLSVPNVEPKEKREHIQSGFVQLADLVSHEEDYENWSRLIISQYLKHDLRNAQAPKVGRNVAYGHGF